MPPTIVPIPIKPNWGIRIAKKALQIYQNVFSWDHQWRYRFGGRRQCRYYPSCSQYMIDAIERHGVGKGVFLGLRRLLRCNPFSRGGVDEVA